MQFTEAIEILISFRGDSLTRTIGGIEQNLRGQGATQTATLNSGWKLDTDLLTALAFIKSASAQIDVMVHAVGILWSLPHILLGDERFRGIATSQKPSTAKQMPSAFSECCTRIDS